MTHNNKYFILSTNLRLTKMPSKLSEICGQKWLTVRNHWWQQILLNFGDIFVNSQIRWQNEISVPHWLKAIEHYLKVCAGKPDSTEMKMKWMVHLHFSAVRFSYLHTLVVFNGMTPITNTALLSYHILHTGCIGAGVLCFTRELYGGVPLHIIL